MAVDYSLQGQRLLDRMVPMMRARLPDDIGPDYLDGFIARNRAELVSMFADFLAKRAAKLAARGAAPAPEAASVPVPAGAPSTWSARERTRVNLAAMQFLADGRQVRTDADRALLRGYSGWGGLSLAKVAASFPPGFPVPEARGLVHEYYTPLRGWRAVLDHVLGPGGPLHGESSVRALEPSVGIGRALVAGEPYRPALAWTTVEASDVSSRLVRALYPPTPTGYHREARAGFFEEHATSLGERFDLVVSNPPYGPRGSAAELDSDPRFETKRAYLYFMARTLDLLRPAGIAAFVVPTDRKSVV